MAVDIRTNATVAAIRELPAIREFILGRLNIGIFILSTLASSRFSLVRLRVFSFKVISIFQCVDGFHGVDQFKAAGSIVWQRKSLDLDIVETHLRRAPHQRVLVIHPDRRTQLSVLHMQGNGRSGRLRVRRREWLQV